MSSNPQPATESSGPTVPEPAEFHWFSSKELRPLAWTTAVALCAGLMHILGAAVESGKLHALSMYGFSRPAFSQEYVIYGAIAMIAIFSPAITALILATILSKITRILYRRISVRFGRPVPAYGAQVAWWIAIIVVIVGLDALNGIAFDLTRQANGMILKHQEDVGSTWMNMVLDEDLGWFSLYWLGLCGGMGLLAVVGRWVVSGFNIQRYKILFFAWLSLQVAVLCVQCSYILGASLTIDRYPIVAFSNSGQMLGRDVIPILIGEDDKQFAILVAYTCTSRGNPSNIVLYIPRSEVKWMTVVKEEPLHLYAHLRELAQKTVTPCQAESSSSPAGTPK